MDETTNGQPIDETAAQAAEYLAGWKRAQADYANLKKDTDREKAQFVKYANENLLSELLPAIDQFETALAFTPDISALPVDQQKPLKNWIIGLHAVRSLWENAFQNIGLQKVRSTGAFDPTMHEAVGYEETPDVAAGEIIRTMQDGWKLHDKLLRPAKVIVSRETPIEK